MIEETWKDIAGYEGLYQVSDFGEVRSLGMWATGKNGSKRFVKGRVLKPGKNTKGYFYVGLCNNGKVKTHKIHRLVASTFIDNPDNLPEVNHIDEVKTNNRVDNLEWCDRKYNVNYGTGIQRAAEARRNDPKQSKKVLQLTLDGVLIKEWPSTRECDRNGFNHGVVSACCRNEYGLQKNVYNGYMWVYAEDYYKQVA